MDVLCQVCFLILLRYLHADPSQGRTDILDLRAFLEATAPEIVVDSDGSESTVPMDLSESI